MVNNDASKYCGTLGGGNFDTAKVRETAEKAIEPFNTTKRISFVPKCMCRIKAAQAWLSPCTSWRRMLSNTGALSNDTGRVRIEWRSNQGEFSFLWGETGGPVVRKPERIGFGTLLINMVGSSLGRKASIDYRPEVCCLRLKPRPPSFDTRASGQATWSTAANSVSF
jgi:hypothetical protein